MSGRIHVNLTIYGTADAWRISRRSRLPLAATGTVDVGGREAGINPSHVSLATGMRTLLALSLDSAIQPLGWRSSDSASCKCLCKSGRVCCA
jgi:hypothetical protein